MTRNRKIVWGCLLGLFSIVILGSLILPFFMRAKAYSGPGMGGSLRQIEEQKRAWQSENTNEWPTGNDLMGNESASRFNKSRGGRDGELIIINRTGEPPVAYIPKDYAGNRAGEFWCLNTNGPGIVRFTGQLDARAWEASGITPIPKLKR